MLFAVCLAAALHLADARTALLLAAGGSCHASPSWLPPRQALTAALILVLQGGEASDGLSCTGLQCLVVVMLQLSRDPAAHLLAGPIEVRRQQPMSVIVG